MAEPTSLTLGTPIVVSVSAASAVSAAIGTANAGQPNATTTVRLASTVETWIETGTAPVAVSATAPAFLLPAGVVEYIDLPFGHKIAGIAGSAGSLSITPCTKG